MRLDGLDDALSLRLPEAPHRGGLLDRLVGRPSGHGDRGRPDERRRHPAAPPPPSPPPLPPPPHPPPPPPRPPRRGGPHAAGVRLAPPSRIRSVTAAGRARELH